MPPKERPLSDLVRDAKIETEFLESCVRHIFHEAGRSASQRHIQREERWVKQKLLGQGRYSTVYLEKCQNEKGEIL